jgi:hypothetical protein
MNFWVDGAADGTGQFTFGRTFNTTWMTIDDSGRVGIGNTSPDDYLTIADTSTSGDIGLRFKGDASSRQFIMFGDPDGAQLGDIMYDHGTNAMRFRVNNSPAAIIDSSGRLGVGTTTPGSYSANNLVVANTGGGAGITIATSTSDYGRIFFADGTTGNAPYRGVIQYDHANDALEFKTADSAAVYIDSSQRVGVGTTSPDERLHVSGNIALGGGSNEARISLEEPTNSLVLEADPINTATGSYIRFKTDDLDRATIDSSGRMILGATSSTAVASAEGAIQLHYQFTGNGAAIAIARYADDAAGPQLNFGKSRSGTAGSPGTVPNGGDLYGQITFCGDNGTNLDTQAVRIQAVADGVPSTGTNDMPGRLVIATNSDGTATGITERMRITSVGFTKMSNYGGYQANTDAYHELVTNRTDTQAVIVGAKTTSYGQRMLVTNCDRSASDAYNFFSTFSGNLTDIEHTLRGDGNAYADGSWNGGGADYAEYFEWSDGNTAAEDRRGISVVLDGDKIRAAVAGEEPIGVISGNPSVVGDTDIDRWKGKYLRDDFGTYIQEDYEVEDEDGNIVTQQRRKLNPDYDPDQEYISREDRPEWDMVGLMGKLRIRKGQVTGSRWIKMRDINDNVEEWLVR